MERQKEKEKTLPALNSHNQRVVRRSKHKEMREYKDEQGSKIRAHYQRAVSPHGTKENQRK